LRRRDIERGVWRENPKEEIALEDLGVDGWMATKLTFKKLDWGANWINLAQNSVAVDSVMISVLHKKRRTSSIAEQLSACE